MKSYVVYHLIHVQTPYQHNPKLVITGVPDEVDLTEEDIDRGGYQFGEFGSAWANYRLTQIKSKEDMPSDLVAKLHEGGYETISYADLDKPFPFQQ